jgi:trk system potassium uptake protein TrkH
MLSVEGKIMLITLMMVGGTAFSTAGGIKVGRILQIVKKMTRRKFTADTSTRSISSASSRYSSFNMYEPKTEKIKEEKTFNEAVMVIVMFVAVSFVTAVVLWHIEQKDFLDSMFESVSALTTTGITAGITSMDMNLVSKAFLVVNMIAGRFEIIAIVYLFLEISRRKKK